MQNCIFTSILNSNNDVMFWENIPYRAFCDSCQEYIVPSENQNNYKKRILIQEGCDLLYLNKQQLLKIDITNMTIQRMKSNKFGDGVKLSQKACNFEFYGDVESIYESLRKFTIQSDFTVQYLVKKQIGKGTYGKVYLAQHKMENKEYAIKVFEKVLLQQEKDIQTVKKELQILRDIEHKNLLKIYETFESEKFIYIVCELIVGGSLSQLLKEKKIFTENEIIDFGQAILSALNHLHDKGIMHRDIKPLNILLRNKGQINDVVVIDFGLSDYYKKEGQYIFTQCGTPGYMAPEILKNKEYDYKVDIYSLGIILYRLINGHSPFKGDNQDDLIQFNSEQCINKQKQKTYMAKLVEQMTQSDPLQRINCQQALKIINKNKITLQILPNPTNNFSPVGLNSSKSPQSVISPNSICSLPQLFEQRQKHTFSSFQPSVFRTKRILS